MLDEVGFSVLQGLCSTSNTYVYRSLLAAGAKTIIEVSQPHIYIHWTGIGYLERQS